MQISTNGLISFGSSFSSFRASGLPSTTAPIIAPLWADYDFRDSGAIYYRISQDMNILSYVASLLSTMNPGLVTFQPRLCIIVTWSSASLFSYDFLGRPVNC